MGKPEKSIQIDVSIGELADKITILLIKQRKFRDKEKLQNVARELALLRPVLAAAGFLEDSALFKQLKIVNEDLWQIEDAIRMKEANQAFDETFVQLARSVYFKNDDRSRLKRQINEQFGSSLIEEKEYTPY